MSAKPSQLDPEGDSEEHTPPSWSPVSYTALRCLMWLLVGGLCTTDHQLCVYASPRLVFFILAHLWSAWISGPIFLSRRTPGLQFPEFFCVRECRPLACFSEDPLAEPAVFPSGLFLLNFM